MLGIFSFIITWYAFATLITRLDAICDGPETVFLVNMMLAFFTVMVGRVFADCVIFIWKNAPWVSSN